VSEKVRLEIDFQLEEGPEAVAEEAEAEWPIAS
jgi:hypothetical protein